MEKNKVLQPEQKALKNVEKNVQLANGKNAQKKQDFFMQNVENFFGVS